MKYYYLNCMPEKKEVIKRKMKSFCESPYIVLDHLSGCDEMLVVGQMSPDMLKLQEEARRLNIAITRIPSETDLEKKDSQRLRTKDYNLDY